MAQISSRDPARLAAFGAGGAILFLGLIAFVRVSLRTSRSEVEEAG